MDEENSDINDNLFTIKPTQQMVAACSGAVITALSMTPFDVIKTRLQTQQKTQLSNKCFLYCNGLMDHLCPCPYSPNGNGNGVPVQHYKGTIDAMIKISRNEGLLSLWSGLTPTLVLAVPATVMYFVVYDDLRQRYTRQYLLKYPNAENSLSLLPPLFAGMSARTMSATLFNPLELIRTKLQSEKLSYFDLSKALKSMIAREGITGLWKGLGPTLWRDVPFSGIYWSVYETYKRHFIYLTDSKTPSFWFSFIGGGIAGSIAALVTTPFDVIKTQKQIAFGERFLYPESKTHPTVVSTFEMIRQIYTTNGIKGLFAGLTPRLVKIAPACAIMIASFEYGKLFFKNYNKNNYYLSINNNHNHNSSKEMNKVLNVT